MQQVRISYGGKNINLDYHVPQSLFVQDVQNGVNDEFTKLYAYFVTNRYCSNNGNIYELYDYIKSHKNLVFLQKASSLYPYIFQLISSRTFAPKSSPASTLAYLAYLEVFERSGYADMAMRSAAAHQYIQLAYFAQQHPETLNSGINRVQNVFMKKNKALFFAEAAKKDVALIFDGKIGNTPELSQIIGLSHYAVTLRYFELMGEEFSSPKAADEIFALCKKMIQEKRLFHLSPFVGFLDASTLLFSSESDPYEIKQAFQPLLDIDLSLPIRNSIVSRVLFSRKQAMVFSDKIQLSKNLRFGIFSQKHIVDLAKKVPDFHAWLIAGGWSQGDFEM